MSKFRKKPVIIEAFLFTGGPDQEEDPIWIVEAIRGGIVTFEDGVLLIKTLEGVMTGSPGDYIIQGVEGEIYPCKPGIFKQTYDAVTPRWMLDDEAGAMDSVPTDTERLDKLQNLTRGYGAGWKLRKSTTFRGMRLHETEEKGAYTDVRLAIDAYHPPKTSLRFDNKPPKGGEK